ncbi:MAG: 3-isopropylmalate dehydratase small subunit [Candidatus Omnitrophica bacterium]|nr:3-isopropylmalate dehydratase small subunit [Candidatus Omnitrophota bacterium]MDD5429406.1 3-isopropylmalate dehydratase small subunit [Candidatus Omnitrophota bacterium]
MIIKGKVHKFGDNINTDDIIAAKYLDSQDHIFLGSKAMENIDPGFSKRVQKGEIIVAGKNFGCGSSREHAPWALKGCGISIVIAESFARIFYRNSINVGLVIMVCSQTSKINAGDNLKVDLTQGLIYDQELKKEFKSETFPSFMQEIITSGGLINWIKRKKKK